MFRSLFIFLIVVSTLQCSQRQRNSDPIPVKIKGLIFTGPGKGPLENQMFGSMKNVNSNFVSLVPEATVYRQDVRVVYDFENQWYGERKKATIEGIALARLQGLKVMIKPHLTIGWDMSEWKRPALDWKDSLSRIQYMTSARGFIDQQASKIEAKSHWRGEFMTTSDEDWQVFEDGYTAYILDYAQIADSLQVDLFCIGTEMKRTALEKPEFWRKLIEKVRKEYSGPITYAANWDSYDKIEFWDALDYIGVDAYFPLSQSINPDLVELKSSWSNVSKNLETLSEKFGKQLILTEWGYENEDYVGSEPWTMGRFNNATDSINNTAQALAYQSMFETVWQERWMKGVFVWRWSSKSGVSQRPNYSPRGKKAEEVLRVWFK